MDRWPRCLRSPKVVNIGHLPQISRFPRWCCPRQLLERAKHQKMVSFIPTSYPQPRSLCDYRGFQKKRATHLPYHSTDSAVHPLALVVLRTLCVDGQLTDVTASTWDLGHKIWKIVSHRWGCSAETTYVASCLA